MEDIKLRGRSHSPPGPISQAGILDNLTGSWRYLRPRYEEKRAPCMAACPAGEHVEEWIRLFEQEKYLEAWRLVKTVNPFPRVCGRVCFHPCETECNRGELDRPIAIHALERFVADHAKSLGEHIIVNTEKTGKTIGVIGSGPAGLSCAYHLANRGHSVTIYEAETEPGGLLRYGIPAYRLPRDVLNEEIEDIVGLGIEVRAGTRIDDLEELRRAHDAVFVGAGLGKSNTLGIPGEQGFGAWNAITFLNLVNSGQAPAIHGRVAVIGGGNAAIDAARTALRLGAEPTVLYRRSRVEMPVYAPEIEEAEKEGVSFLYKVQPVEVIREHDTIAVIECVRNRLGDPDSSGRRKPTPIEDSNFPVEANSIIIAAGETPDETLLPDGNPDGVFVGGDLTSPQRTVAHAIGSGRKAAEAIHRFLGGTDKDVEESRTPEIVKFEDINLDYFPPKSRIRLPMLPLHEREKNFDEIYCPIGNNAAAEEADRCFHCGACTSCDNCYIYCPDIAVKRDSDGEYSIDYDYCKGCGLCVHECPRNAMSIDEEIRE